MMSAPLFASALVLAAAFGFLTRWVNICVVHAGEQWLIRGRIDSLLDFACCAAFSGLLLLPLAWADPDWMQLSAAATPSVPLLAGALLFGLGTTVNGACAFGTVARVGAGDLALLMSLPGYALGLAAGRGVGMGPVPTLPSPVGHFSALALFWWLLLVAVAAIRLRAIAAAPQTPRRRHDRLLLLAMSVCGGLLFAIVRNSIYGRAVEPGVRWLFRIPGMYEWSGALLLSAVFVGATAAGIVRREWKLRPPAALRSLRCLAGGLLMGAGAALIPGGNDFLILWGAPSAAVDAIVALPVMLAGVLVGLRLGGARRQSQAATVN